MRTVAIFSASRLTKPCKSSAPAIQTTLSTWTDLECCTWQCRWRTCVSAATQIPSPWLAGWSNKWLSLTLIVVNGQLSEWPPQVSFAGKSFTEWPKRLAAEVSSLPSLGNRKEATWIGQAGMKVWNHCQYKPSQPISKSSQHRYQQQPSCFEPESWLANETPVEYCS